MNKHTMNQIACPTGHLRMPEPEAVAREIVAEVSSAIDILLTYDVVLTILRAHYKPKTPLTSRIFCVIFTHSGPTQN